MKIQIVDKTSGKVLNTIDTEVEEKNEVVKRKDLLNILDGIVERVNYFETLSSKFERSANKKDSGNLAEILHILNSQLEFIERHEDEKERYYKSFYGKYALNADLKKEEITKLQEICKKVINEKTEVIKSGVEFIPKTFYAKTETEELTAYRNSIRNEINKVYNNPEHTFASISNSEVILSSTRKVEELTKIINDCNAIIDMRNKRGSKYHVKEYWGAGRLSGANAPCSGAGYSRWLNTTKLA